MASYTIIMNTYAKYCPGVFCAKCTEPHQKGDTITMTTRHGSEHDAIVFNLLLEKDGYYYYSVVRANGFNKQEWAKRRADRYANAAINAEKQSDQYYQRSQKDAGFLSLGEPIKVGHHSERRHRRAIDEANNNMRKSVEAQDIAKQRQDRAAYYEKLEDKIDLSMPESIDYYEHLLEEARWQHEGMKNGTIERSHSMSLQYANKRVKDLEDKVKTAKKLWGDNL